MSRNRSFFPLIAALSLLAAGCGDTDVHSEHAVITDPVQAITVDVGSGDIDLRGEDVAEVTVNARVEGAANHLGHALTDGQLSLVDDCHENHCSVDISAVVPAGVPIEVHTGSGDLVLESLLGTIRLRTGSGNIVGHDIAGADLDAETGSGDVTLEVGEPAESIHVRTSSGDVLLGVPSGRYRLAVGTSSGDRHMQAIQNDPNAAGAIDVLTSSGDVALLGY